MNESKRELLQKIITPILFLVILYIEFKVLFTPGYCSINPLLYVSFFGLIILWTIVIFLSRVQRKTFIKAIIFLVISMGLIFFLRISINPGLSISKANNTTRLADISRIKAAIVQYDIDHQGIYPACKSNPEYPIPESETCLGMGSECCNLEQLVSEGYLTSLPTDPAIDAKKDSGYTIKQVGDQICVKASNTQEVCGEIEGIKLCF